jgi:hypothetical protein
MACRLLRIPVAVAVLVMAVIASASAQSGRLQVAGSADEPMTDLNMVVALDRSESVELLDRTAQVEALATALTDPRFMATVRGGWQGRIGIAVMTWSSFDRTQVVVPWTMISGLRDSEAVIAIMRDYEARGGDFKHKPQTDIALALGAGMQLLEAAPFPASKRILNVISDGVDNFGREAFVERDQALAQGITINGLVHARGAAIEVVERFFEREVIGGPYAFVLSTPTPASFTAAMLRKMMLEIAQANTSSRPDDSGSVRVPAYHRLRG